MARLCSFTKKEVVNIQDGRRLGFLSDAEINLYSGELEAIIISVPAKNVTVGSDCNELTVPFSKIKKIGEDVILVNIEERYLNVFMRGQT